MYFQISLNRSYAMHCLSHLLWHCLWHLLCHWKSTDAMIILLGIGLMTSCSVICHVIGYVFCLAIVQAISHVIVYGIWYDMSNVIGYTIRDISIGYSIGYVTCNASNIPLACAFASNIFGLDLRHCLRILLSDFFLCN